MDVQSDVQTFFKNKTIFVTGATGFLGKLLVEKLLRSCDCDKIYILMRPKKGKSEQERFAEIFDQECFAPLRIARPNFLEKIRIINGDLTNPDLGLDDASKDALIREVDAIFHVAATVKFDEHLKIATYINIRSVRDLLRIAKRMKKLKAFVHVSTAYSHCVRTDIGETIYDTPITGENMIKVVDAFDDDKIAKITPHVLGEWPNSYVFTKALGEQVLKTEGEGLPVAMIRPAIVTTSVKEPVPGWIDNIYGVNGVVAGVGMGIIRTMPAEPEANAETVPVDFVINNTICAAWDVAKPKSMRVIDVGDDIPVYNYVHSTFRKLTWDKFFEYCIKEGSIHPPDKAIWYIYFAFRPHPISHELAIFFLHTIPAYLIDLIFVCLGQKPRAVRGYKKVRKYLDVIAYFAKKNWNFSSENVHKLMGAMSKKDRETFDFDLRGVDFEKVLQRGIVGGRQYLLKDPLETVPRARRKMMILRVVHYAVCAFLFYILFQILSFLYSFLF